MGQPKNEMKLVNPDTKPAPLTPQARRDIAAIAARQDAANSVLMRVITYAGSQVDDGLSLLPTKARAQIEAAAHRALSHSFTAASQSRKSGPLARLSGDRAHKILGTISGALGGLGGLPTALLELPVATTVIFRAVQDVAAQYGEDPTSAETRIECLRVFGAGGPGGADDSIDTAFIGARISLTGPALNGLLRTIAPRFATVLGQKLAAQTIPILGAAAGAGTNYAFVEYYVEMAHVHFGLRQLARAHDETTVHDQFHQDLAARKIPINRA